jgi:hypothetical protein
MSIEDKDREFQGQSQQTEQIQVDTDWDKDNFPTSAKPVFQRTGFLIFVVSLLCGLAYYYSDFSEEEEIKKTIKVEAEAHFGAEEDTIVPGSSATTLE